MRKTHFTFLGLLLIALGAIYWLNTVSPAPEAEETVSQNNNTPKPNTTTVAKEPVADYPAIFWRKGDRRMYRVSMITDYWLMSALSSSKSPEDQGQKIFGQIEAVLNFRVFDFDGVGIWAAFQLSPVSVRFGGVSYPLLEEVYSTFFLVAFLASGKILQSYFPDTIGEQEQKSLLEILNLMQIEMPDNKQETGWISSEKNATGTYSASYSYAGAGRINKKKTAYTEVNSIFDAGTQGQGQRNFEIAILDSRYEAFLSRTESWIDTVKIFDHYEVREVGNTWVKSKVALDLLPIAFSPNMELRIWTEKGSIKDIISSFITPPHLRKMSQGAFEKQRLESLRQKWEKISVQEMAGRAVNMAHDKSMTQHDFMRFVHGLVDMLEAFPERALDIPRMFKEMDMDGETASLLLQALEISGHTESQNALEIVLLDEEIRNDVRIHAIVATGGLKNPHDNVHNAIWSLVGNRLDLIQVDSSLIKQTQDGELTEADKKILEDSERISTAFLAMGILSHTYRENGLEAKADEINQRMAEMLAETSKPDAIALAFKAFDNSGNIDAIEDISPYVTAESVAIRASAVAALKNRDDDQTLALLSERLEKDEVSLVRDKAMDALEVREPQVVAPKYAEHLPREDDFSLRMRMADWLGRNKEAAPIAITALQEQLTKEESREVVKEIYKAIYRKEEKKIAPPPPGEERVIYVPGDKNELFSEPSPAEKSEITSNEDVVVE